MHVLHFALNGGSYVTWIVLINVASNGHTIMTCVIQSPLITVLLKMLFRYIYLASEANYYKNWGGLGSHNLIHSKNVTNPCKGTEIILLASSITMGYLISQFHLTPETGHHTKRRLAFWATFGYNYSQYRC